LGACMSPVDVDVFVNDKTVQDVIKSNQKSVKLTSDSPTYLKPGDKKITNLKGDKYYRIVSENDENAKPVPNTEYPTPNKYPRYVLETGQTEDDLTVIKRVPGGTIVSLRNDHTYKVEEAVAFAGDTLTITSNATITKDSNTITVTPTAGGAITLGGFSTHGDYEVMGVVVSTNKAAGNFSSGMKTVGTGFNLELPTTADTVVDYVFAKADGKFEYLNVIVKSLGHTNQVSEKPIQITAPVTDVAPTTAISNTTQYTGTISWTPSVIGAFQPDTEYTAEITLTPVAGYTLTGLASGFFTVTVAKSVTFDGTNKVTVVFQKTALRPVTEKPIQITAPANGIAPTTAISNTAQYTGTISWTPSVIGAFQPDTEYTAEITLTPVAGYTLAGLASNFFTVTVAKSVTFDGTNKVTVVFQKTGSKPQGSVTVNITFTTPSNKFTGGTANIPVTGAGSASFSFTVSGGSSVTNIEWYQDGRKLSNTSYTLTLNSITNINIIGIHEFMAIAKVDGVPYSATFVLTVTEE